MTFVYCMKSRMLFWVLLPILLFAHTAVGTPFQYCSNYLGEKIEDGVQFIPNADDLCYKCTCDGGYPVACSSVFCSPPDCRLYEVIEDECCKFICLEAADEPDGININDTGEPALPKDGLEYMDSSNLPLRLVASTVTSFLILALLLFMVHRLRQRRTLIMLRRLNAERQEEDTVAYLPQMDNVDIGIEFPPYEDPPPPYTPPKPPYIPEGEAPPPYDNPDSGVIGNDNDPALPEWIEGNIRQCNGLANETSTEGGLSDPLSCPYNVSRDHTLINNCSCHDLNTDQIMLQEVEVLRVMDNLCTCGKGIVEHRTKQQACPGPNTDVNSNMAHEVSPAIATCEARVNYLDVDGKVVSSSSTELKFHSTEVVCQNPAGTVDLTSNSEDEPACLTQSRPCCLSSTMTGNKQLYTEIIAESINTNILNSDTDSSPLSTNQDNTQQDSYCQDDATLFDYSHCWECDIHSTLCNNSQAESVHQKMRTNSQGVDSGNCVCVTLTGKYKTSLILNIPTENEQCSHCRDTEISVCKCYGLNSVVIIPGSTPRYQQQISTNSASGLYPDISGSAPCSSGTAKIDSFTPLAVLSIQSPSDSCMVNKSESLKSELSVISICSETGERKRPPLYTTHDILQPDVKYPDNVQDFHHPMRESFALHISRSSCPEEDNTKDLEAKSQYNNLVEDLNTSTEHEQSLTDKSSSEFMMTPEHNNKLSRSREENIISGSSAKNTSLVQVTHQLQPQLKQSAESPLMPWFHFESGHGTTKKKRSQLSTHGSADCKSSSRDKKKENSRTQFKQYGFIDNPEVLMAYKDNTVCPAAWDKIHSVTAVEELHCHHSQFSEKIAGKSLDQNSSSYSLKSIADEWSNDSTIQRSRSHENKYQQEQNYDVNTDSTQGSGTPKPNLMHWCLNSGMTDGSDKTHSSKQRRKHKGDIKPYKTKNKNTCITSRHLANNVKGDAMNNNAVDNYTVINTQKVLTDVENTENLLPDNIRNRIIDPDGHITNDYDYITR